MKKLILFLIFICFSVPIFGQSIWWVDTTATGEERKIYLGDYDSIRTNGGINFGRLPVKATISGAVSAEGIDSLITEITAINAYIALINSKTSPSNKGADSNSATVSTEVDTIDISTATTWAEFAIFAVNDTLEYSKDGTSWRRVFPYMFASTGKISPITYPKIYIRRKGTEGTVTYDYSWIGY